MGILGALFVIGSGCGTSKDGEINHVEITDTSEITATSEGTDDISAQLKLIADNNDMWYVSDAYNTYFYTVTDLDENGQLELIAASCQGSGLYTYSTFYEVNENKNNLSECTYNVFEGDSGPDIITTRTTRYRSDGNIYYQFIDAARNGMAEQYVAQTMLYLNNGSVSYFVFAREATKADAAGNVTTTYYNANDDIIDETAYLNKCQNPLEVEGEAVTLYWSDLSEGTLLETLTEAYESFAGLN